jgi:hypothetical protein
LRATGHALIYASMGCACVAFIVMGAIAVAGRDRPVYWGSPYGSVQFQHGHALTVQEFAPHYGAGSVGAADLGKPGPLEHGESSSEDGRW